MRRFLLLQLLLCTVITGAIAQKKACFTTEANQYKQAALRQQGSRVANLASSNNGNANRTSVVYNIPVIVHIIHNGEAEGVGRNISAAQVQSQITRLNQDFRKLNSDFSNVPGVFQGVAADVELNFCLAQVNQSGVTLTQPGINRVNRNTAGFSAPPYSFFYFESNVKPATIWNANNYFNIWVSELTGDILGYAQFPDNTAGLGGLDAFGGASNTDGVMIDYQAFGSTGTAQAPYNLGRTATHEIGHFFGLRHIWGDANCGNDFCNDTPTQLEENYNCPSFPSITCSNGPNGDMFMNFMDYVNDACGLMFTANQKARIQAVMAANTPRRTSLATSTVCNATSAPITDFSSNKTTVVAGCSVVFTDQSSGNPSSWAWNFGDPASGANNTSTAQNPSHTYNTPGTYTVTLVATNGNGSNTKTKTNYIAVNSFKCVDTTSNFIGTAAIYTVTAPQSGYVAGHNSYLDKAKAEKFTFCGTSSKLTRVVLFFGVAKGTGNVTVNVWNANGAGGAPLSVLTSQTLPISSIVTGQATVVNLNTPVTVSGDFYAGISFTNAPGDTVALFTNLTTNALTNTAWEQQSNNVWYPYSSASAWNISLNHAVYAIFENANNALTGSAGGSQVCGSQGVVTGGSTFVETSTCNTIAKVVPSGATPVAGTVNTCVKIDASVQRFNAIPYVQRHYDISPVTAAAASTGTITLYFSDAEFVAYNAARTIYPPLPTVATGGNADAARANLRITQYHGTSATSTPGTYSGAAELIDPADASIVYNGTAARWEVTFSVTGFSGFFVQTANFVLPVSWQYFRGSKVNNTNQLTWKMQCSSASIKMELERSADGRRFETINSITATQARCAQPFDYTDARPLSGANYYRIKTTEPDGKVAYSIVVVLLNKEKGFEIVSLIPTVVNDRSVLNVVAANQSKLSINITDVQGRLVQTTSQTVSAGATSIELNLGKLSSGTYMLTAFSTEGNSKTIRFVKQ